MGQTGANSGRLRAQAAASANSGLIRLHQLSNANRRRGWLVTRDAILAEFQRYQSLVLTLLAAVEPVLNTPRHLRDLAAVKDRRPEMQGILTKYQVFKHRNIFDPTIAEGILARAELATTLKADCIALDVEYARFVKRWTGRDASDHWPEYRLSAIRMIRVIRQHLTVEHDSVVALLKEDNLH